MSKKLGIIVPYRDRYDQLIAFKRRIKLYLKRDKIDYELIIVEQDDSKTFNRGKLLNIGFLEAKKLGCDYVVFHDVDMLPVTADYSYSNYPIHLVSEFKKRNNDFKRIIFDEYFGGVTLFPINDFEEINGYSNEYWGWGYEDDDLLYRCKVKGIKLNEKKIKMMGGNVASLKFNGTDAFVEGNNTFNLQSPITFFISFFPNDIYCDHTKYDDTYCIFTIPGLDLTINYNSYSRYNFEAYDVNENVIYINSDIKTNYSTNITVTINPIDKKITMYQDGNIVGEKMYTRELYDYESVRKFYLGVGNKRNKDNPKYFNGYINSFVVFNKELSNDEIVEISNNQHFGMTQNFGEYKSADYVHLYYDSKFIKNYKLMDLSGNENHGKITNCEIVGNNYEDYKITHIPNRRNGMFELYPHEENGYVNGSWKDQTTRYNQMRYYNELIRGFKYITQDGLNNCKFREITKVKVDNETQLLVSI
jgi:hypothetical protein